MKMKNEIILIIAAITIIDLVGGITKEKAIPKVTVRLVKKDWSPAGYRPKTDDPLPGFPGNYTELFKLFKEYKHKFKHVSQPLKSAVKLFDDPNYNPNLPSVIITHPMTIGDSLFISHVVGVLALRNLQKHYNIFAMHAPWLSWQFQMSCLRVAIGLDPEIKPVAEAFASFLLDGIALGKLKPHQINFIGFSYSATLNAYIAREIRDNTGQLTHTLLTLDAFQYNHNNQFYSPITKADAMFVHMFHSSSRFGGTLQRVGTVDIVLNNGYFQPGCASSVNSGIGCSHRRSVAVFIFSLLNQGNVVARQCDSWENFQQCKCSSEDNAMLVVSFPVNEEARGTFYLRTNDKMPFVLGPIGAKCQGEVAKDETSNIPAVALPY